MRVLEETKPVRDERRWMEQVMKADEQVEKSGFTRRSWMRKRS
jgi:hypothetical protein